ncbi:hypothetical protein SDC9_139128 [bioreactor metagenome]|uniref:Uncharacterized protein n=1 Tax=bioreactor metagenome TaxID=1076179 RepID=A0A645DR98_9ZZZZ
MPWQHADHRLALLAQCGNGGSHLRVITPGGANGSLERTLGHDSHQLFDIETEAGSWTIAPEHCTDFVVTATAHQGIAAARHIDRKARAAVVGVATQIGQVEADLDAIQMLHQPAQM